MYVRVQLKRSGFSWVLFSTHAGGSEVALDYPTWLRTLSSPRVQVVLNWFWMDVQRELAVGGDVVQPVRTWGLHSISLLVKGLDAESNPTQYTEASFHVSFGVYTFQFQVGTYVSGGYGSRTLLSSSRRNLTFSRQFS